MSQSPPIIPNQFNSEFSVTFAMPDDTESILNDFRWMNEVESQSIVLYGNLFWNYDIQRSLLNVTKVNHVPHYVSKLHAYDIDNIITIRANVCQANPTFNPMSIFFNWANPNSISPKPGTSFVNETTVTLSNGNEETCDLWKFTYYGECGPTVLPPCTGTVYLCANNNIPVLWKLVDNQNGYFVEINYWNVQVQSQDSSLFSIPNNCSNLYNYPPSSPYGIFDGFENGVADFWLPCGELYARWECGHIYSQDIFVRSGMYSANITCEPGDISQPDTGDSSTERDELDSRTWAILDEDIWYGMSFMLPSDFPIVDDRLVMGQWKQGMAGDKHPLIAQRFVNNTWYYTINVGILEETFYLDELELGVWHDMVYNILFTPSSRGYFRAWHNGTQIIDYEGRTAYEYVAQRFYHKFGIYRDSWPTSWTIFFDKYDITNQKCNSILTIFQCVFSYSIGKSYEDVNPTRFDY